MIRSDFFSDVDELLAKAIDDCDALLIGTQCHLHAPLAVAVARSGLPLFLEKPVGISWEQLAALDEAYADRQTPVVVSFPTSSHRPCANGGENSPNRSARYRQSGAGR